MPPWNDLKGRRFGRLIVAGQLPSRARRTRWLCRCDCGARIDVRADHLLDGHCLSCGCLHIDKAKAQGTHGMSESPEYAAWKHAKNRCFNPRDRKYALYGGRGITMSEEWRNNFAAFLAHVGRRPAGTTLDRIDSNGPYAPGNVRWASVRTQVLNRRTAINFRTIDDRIVSLNEVARTLGLYQHELKRLFIRSGVLRHAD